MSPVLLVVIGLVALGIGILVARWFAQANPATIAKTLRWVALSIAFLVVAGVLIRFGPQFLPALLIFAIPFLIARFARGRGWRPPPQGAPGGGRPGAGGKASNVETGYLRMTLDHGTGEMDGEVLRGRFAGRRLHSLDEQEALALRAECEREDPPSVRLIEAYLDRRFGTDWRGHGRDAGPEAGEGDGRQEESDGGPRGGTRMTRAEALEMLGLEEGASRDSVLEAWRRLIKLNHPDHGGSKYIAAKLNEAKRVLLGE